MGSDVFDSVDLYSTQVPWGWICGTLSAVIRCDLHSCEASFAHVRIGGQLYGIYRNLYRLHEVPNQKGLLFERILPDLGWNRKPFPPWFFFILYFGSKEVFSALHIRTERFRKN